MTKREIILQASLDVFVTYGFHGAPVTKLISEAHVSNGTFFHYFKTKEDLITDLYVAIKQSLHQHISTDVSAEYNIKKNIRTIWTSWVQWGVNHPLEFRFLELFSSSPYIHQVDKETMKSAYEFIGEMIRKGIEEEILIRQSPQLISELLYGSIRGTILYYQKNQLTIETDITPIFDMTWKSIVNF